jgi:hypothetical protein
MIRIYAVVGEVATAAAGADIADVKASGSAKGSEGSQQAE